MGRWRGKQYARATTAQKLMFLAGIPSAYWDPMEGVPDFVPFEAEIRDEMVDFSTKQQEEYFLRLLNNPHQLLRSHLIGIGSVEEDRQAMHLAFDMVRDLVQDEDQVEDVVKVVNAAEVPYRPMRKKDPGIAQWWNQADSAKVMVIHNILADHISHERVMTIRDLLVRYEEKTRIVVVAGDNPVDFFLGVIRLLPTVVFYTDGSVKAVAH